MEALVPRSGGRRLNAAHMTNENSMSTLMNTLNVHFDLPKIVALQAGLNADSISHDVKQMFTIFLYEHQRISLSKACELAGMSQWDFFEMNRHLSIPIQYTQNDLALDMEKLRNV
jgi:predicted HTH domain antitoxin